MCDLYDFKTGEKILPEANNIPVAQRISKGLQQLRGMFHETTSKEPPALFNPVDRERHHARLEAELADILKTDEQ